MTTERHEATVQLLSRDAVHHIDDLVAAVLPVLIASEPPGFYDDEGLADLRTSASDALLSLLSVLSGTTQIDDGPLEVPRGIGRRQVQQGLPLEGILRGYRLAGNVLWDHLVTTARESDAHVGDALLDGASEVWRVIDRFCAATAEAFRLEEGQLRDRDERVQSAVLAGLLEGRGADPQFARDATHALGVPTGGPFVCVVGLTETPDALALEGARERLRAGGLASAWTILAGSQFGLVALGTRTASAVRDLLGPAVRTRAGMSPAFIELAELPRARHLAETAARCPGKGVRVLEEDLIAGLVIDAPLVASMLYEQTISLLLATAGPDGPALLETLHAFLEEDGSLSAAAAKSFVHRNTLIYRLNKIEKLTGRSVRVLRDQVVWVLALKEHESRRP